MSKSAPKPPDYAAAADKQAESSKNVTEQQTWANRPDQVTPFGTQSWESTPTYDPVTGQTLNRWTQNTTLNPESQAALDSQLRITNDKSKLAESMIGRTADEYGKEMNWDDFTKLAQTPGTARYGQLPDVPQYSAENIQRSVQKGNYTPEQFQDQLDTSNLQAVDPSQRYQQSATDALNEKFDSRMEPRLQREREQRRTQLYNQGLKEGDEAFDNAMSDVDQGQADTRRQADLDAILTGGQEASRYYGMDSGTRAQQFGERQAEGGFANDAAQARLNQTLGIGGQQFQEEMGAGQFGNAASQQALMQQLGIGEAGFEQGMTKAGAEDTRANTTYGQNMANANYTNQLRQQQIAEEMQKRGLTINEMNAILTGQQVGMPSMPGFNSASKSESTQYNQAAQNQYDAQLDAFNAQNQQMQGMMSGVADIGSSPFKFSDRRLKTDITLLTKHVKTGLFIYEYRYKWDDPKIRRIGVMADEVEKLYPEAVHTTPAGYKMVNYARIP